MTRKTYNEKLNNAGDLPKIEDLSDKPKSMARFGGTKLLVAAPLQYSELMARIPEGKVTTADRIRDYLAKQAGADATCPLTAGFFINISAHASEERDTDKIAWWRTLKAQGELNPKYPDGQQMHLEMEGHMIEQRGKGYFVADFEDSLFDLG